MNIVPNVGHALFPNTDLKRLSMNIKIFGTQIAIANMAMIRSRSNLVCKYIKKPLIIYTMYHYDYCT